MARLMRCRWALRLLLERGGALAARMGAAVLGDTAQEIQQ